MSTHAIRTLVREMWHRHETQAHKHVIRSWRALLLATVIFAGALWFGHREFGIGVLGVRMVEAIGDVLFDRALVTEL